MRSTAASSSVDPYDWVNAPREALYPLSITCAWMRSLISRHRSPGPGSPSVVEW